MNCSAPDCNQPATWQTLLEATGEYVATCAEHADLAWMAEVQEHIGAGI